MGSSRFKLGCRSTVRSCFFLFSLVVVVGRKLHPAIDKSLRLFYGKVKEFTGCYVEQISRSGFLRCFLH